MGKLAEILDKLAEKIEEITASLFPKPVPVRVDSRSRRPRQKQRR